MKYRKIKDLKALEKNPRKISKEDFKKLCVKIKRGMKHFEAHPIILSDRTGELVVISGNQRLKASIEIGLDEIPTTLMSGLNEKQERAIIVEENKHSGEWDYEALPDFASAEELEELGFDRKLIEKSEKGMEIPEVDFTSELLEKNNYLVLFFDNEVDWLNVTSIIDLPTVKNLGGNGKGIGRVVNGSDFINKLK